MPLLIIVFIIGIIWLLSPSSSRTPRPRRIMDSPPRPEPPDELLAPLSECEEPITVHTADADAVDMVCQLRVYLQREVFTPPMPKDTYFKLIFSGICAVKFYSTWDCFDACYKATSGRHNYTVRHHALKLDGEAVTGSPLEADRATHQYVFPYRATGGRLSVLLESPIGSLRKASDIDNTIQLTVVALTRTEVSRLGLDAEEREREAVARRMIDELEQQARELAVAAHLELNFLDPEYRQQYAKQHHTQISTELKARWVVEYRQVLGDEPLRTLLEEQHPHVMPVLTARMQLLAIAERLPFDEQMAHAQQAEERTARARAERIAALVLTYREFEHYERDEWIADYVANPKHQQELLAEGREILEKDQEFHEDKVFIDALKASSLGTYRRATWQTRALALADKLSATPRRLSTEEKEAKILRFRQRMLDRLNVRAQDEIARKLQRFESARLLREQAEDMGLDEDQIDRLEQELLGDLDQDEDDHSNGFKQL